MQAAAVPAVASSTIAAAVADTTAVVAATRAAAEVTPVAVATRAVVAGIAANTKPTEITIFPQPLRLPLTQAGAALFFKSKTIPELD